MPIRLAQLQNRIAEQVVDTQELWENSRMCIGSLTRKDGVSQTLVILIDDVSQQCLVEIDAPECSD